VSSADSIREGGFFLSHSLDRLQLGAAQGSDDHLPGQAQLVAVFGALAEAGAAVGKALARAVFAGRARMVAILVDRILHLVDLNFMIHGFLHIIIPSFQKKYSFFVKTS
jgi:hypothetical protein